MPCLHKARMIGCVSYGLTKSVLEGQLMQQHIPWPGGTTPAGPPSSFQCCRMSTRYQTLQAEGDIANTKHSFSSFCRWNLATHLDLQPGSLSGNSCHCSSSPCARLWAASPWARSVLWPSRSSASAGGRSLENGWKSSILHTTCVISIYCSDINSVCVALF